MVGLVNKHPFYCPFTIEDYLILDNLKSCFVFQNKPNVTLFDNDENDRPFNLKQYLLGLKEKLGFELTGIFYCENSNTHKIELIGNDSDFREILLEFSENIPKAPNEIPQFPFCNLDSEQNRKINEVAEGLKSGKIIGKKIISNAFDLNDELPNTKKNIFNGLIKTIYGCIDDENAFLELENDKSDIITNAINQKEGVALDYALINDIKHNLLDNTFHFIFDIDLHLIDD
ncbi:hypothetical protein Kyoto90A_12380 [Helicobacter pylori]